MAGMTQAQGAIATQVDIACERIVTLIKEGNAMNSEGVKSVSDEAEALISSVKGTGSTALKTAMREQVRTALKTPLPSAEVANAEPDWLKELVDTGRAEVRHLAELNIKSGSVLANTMLEVRRRIMLEDGTPDLMADLQITKDASREIYDGVTRDLDPENDIVRQVKRIKREAQNNMVDTRVRYVLSLNTPPVAPAEDAPQTEHDAYAEKLSDYNAEVAAYSKVERKADETLADAIARKYGFRLLTRSQLTTEAKQRKELEAKGEVPNDEGNDNTGSGSAGVSGTGEDKRTPAKIFLDASEQLAKQVTVLGSVDIDEAFTELDKDTRAATVDYLAAAVRTFTELLARAKTAADIEDEQETANEAAPAEDNAA